MIAHYSALAEASRCRWCSTTPLAHGLRPETSDRGAIRARHANVVAIKEASNSIGRASELRNASDIALIAGEDALIAEFMALGAWA